MSHPQQRLRPAAAGIRLKKKSIGIYNQSIKQSDNDVSSSNNDSSDTSSASETTCPKRNHEGSHYEMNKLSEKKYRRRYLLLQQAYEQRLQALATQVRHVVTELQNDSTITALQQDPLTSEYAQARVAEIIQDCFLGEREKYIKVISEQLAWHTNDLQEAEERVRITQRKEKNVRNKWKQVENELRTVNQELQARVNELAEQQLLVVEQHEMIQLLTEERDTSRLEVEKLRLHIQSFETLKQEYETLRVRTRNESEQERTTYEQLKTQFHHVEMLHEKCEVEKHTATQEITHLKHLLKMADTKTQDMTRSLTQLQQEEYPSKILRLEHQIAQQRHVNETLEKEIEQLKKKYEDFGAQVEVYMEEQALERSVLVKQAQEQTRQLKQDIENARQQGENALKIKQTELIRVVDQLKFRQEALTKADQKNIALEERVNTLEATLADEKLRSSHATSALDKELIHSRGILEREREKTKELEENIRQVRDTYERKLTEVQEAFEQQQQQSIKERELESRTRWQNDFVAKQEARIEALKAKYDAALESQQSELLRARQLALDTAKQAVDQVKTQRVDDEANRRQDARNTELVRQEMMKAREASIQRQQSELDAREQRLRDYEQRLIEKERKDEQQKIEVSSAAIAEAKKKTETPSVVVLNLNGSGDEEGNEFVDEKETAAMKSKKLKSSATVVVNKPRPSVAAAMARAAAASAQAAADHQEYINQHLHDDCVPKAQHKAELQARDAQIALEAEKRLQKEMQEFQERKEKELRNAMVNVRKGIQKLETSLEHERTDRKRFEEELLRERQAFIHLKSEADDARDAKLTLIQRLEEANDNIGRLRDVVKDAHVKRVEMEELHRAVTIEKENALQLATRTKVSLDESTSMVTSLTKERDEIEKQRRSDETRIQELGQKVETLGRDLKNQEQELRAIIAKQEQQAIHDVEEIRVNAANELQAMETRYHAQQEENLQLEKSIEVISTQKEILERECASAKADLIKQRKEFNDLSRMHKNLSETMNARIHDEVLRREGVEQELKMTQRHYQQNISSHKKALQLCWTRVRSLQAECTSLRKGITGDIKASLTQIKAETQLSGREMQRYMENIIQRKGLMHDRDQQKEIEGWRQRVAQKEKEMHTMLADRTVDDQAKYDQLMGRLEAKMMELDVKDQELMSHVRSMEKMEASIAELSQNLDRVTLEKSQVTNEFSRMQSTMEREREEHNELRRELTRLEQICQVFHKSVNSIVSEYQLCETEPMRNGKTLFGRGVKFDDEFDDEVKAKVTWDVKVVNTELRKVCDQLRGHIDKIITQQREEAIRPFQLEIDTAKTSLRSLQVEGKEGDNEVFQHLPWYIAVSRSIKQQLDKARHEAEVALSTIVVKDAALVDSKRTQDAMIEQHRAALFEKQTVVCELERQVQILQKKRDQDLDQQREEFEQKMFQEQRREVKDQLKLNEDHQLERDQLAAAFENERKGHSKLKDAHALTRMELEKVQVVLQENTRKFEKETEELREEVLKWKRKAKSACKSTGNLTPRTPTRHQSVIFSPSTQGTDDEDSLNGSYNSMFPPSRRPSTAMKDLSNLMEQSLQELRKDNEVIAAMQLQRTPLPSPLRTPKTTPKTANTPSSTLPPRTPSTSSAHTPLRVITTPSTVPAVPRRRATVSVPSLIDATPRMLQPPSGSYPLS